MLRILFLVVVACASSQPGHVLAQPVQRGPVPDELFAEATTPDIGVSPSGRYVALAGFENGTSSIVVVDQQARSKTEILRFDKGIVGIKGDVRIANVFWKTDQRLLFRVKVKENADPIMLRAYKSLRVFGPDELTRRLFAIDRDGKNLVAMLADDKDPEQRRARDSSDVISLLRDVPNKIMVVVRTFHSDGNSNFGLYRSLYEVDVTTGQGRVVEKPDENTASWWLDATGKVVARVEFQYNYLRYMRKEPDGSWSEFYKIIRKTLDDRADQGDFLYLGSSNDPSIYYVVGRPESADRIGVYRYDLQRGAFGERVLEHPIYDMHTARPSLDRSKIEYGCYIAHVLTCDFTDAKVNAHMKAIRKFFPDTVNVSVFDTSDANNVIVFRVDGADRAPAFYLYDLNQRTIDLLAAETKSLVGRTLPTAEVVDWASHDGLQLSGYLIRPAAALHAGKRPLIVRLHDGPNSREYLRFNATDQFLASRGYAVFLPNFRGSSGFGLEFVRKGYGEWAGKMLDDIAAGVQSLRASGAVDPDRVCVIGVGYGGYAALMSAAQNSNPYRCIVSIGGVTDLERFVSWQQLTTGRDSKRYKFLVDAVGKVAADPNTLGLKSPTGVVGAIAAPVLLVHAQYDFDVPLTQSQLLHRLLKQANKSTELIALEAHQHFDWSLEQRKETALLLNRFLASHLIADTAANGAVSH